MVTIDLHAPQIQGFFKVPVDDLYAHAGALRCRSRPKALPDLVVVAPDAGFAKKARQCVPPAPRTRWPSPTSSAIDHSESAEVLELIG